MRINWHPFFETPGDKGGGGGESGTAVLDKGAIREKQPKADEDTGLIDTLIGDKDLLDMDEQDKEEKPDKEEVEELEVEEPEIDTNARGIDLTKIKEKYPDFAKTDEFKELRNAYYRETKYTELFPTIEDAKEAAENNETFNKLNNDLVNNGDPASLLMAVKEANPEAYKKLATGFLDTLAKMDNATFTEAVDPVIRRAARRIFDDGQRILKRNPESDDGKALVATARNIMQHFFEDPDAINKEEPKPDTRLTEKERELSQRENAIKQERFQGAANLTISSVEKNLDKMILQGLDPDGKFNEFTRDTLVEKIKNGIKGQIDKDSLHVRKMGSLWKRAEAEGYSRDSLSRIVSAYLERARPIIPGVRNKFRSIAIKGRTPDTDDNESNNERGPRIVSRGRSGRAPENDGKTNLKRADPKKIDYAHTSDDDIFEGKVKLKG